MVNIVRLFKINTLMENLRKGWTTQKNEPDLLITTTMTEENFSVLKCANCGGWGTIGKIGKTCPSCKGKGVLIIDNFTGEILNPIKDIMIDEDGSKQTI